MRIDNLTRLMHAKLLNNPSILSVENFTFNLKDVSLGSAFLAVNASDDDVRIAVKKGAYAIIFDNNFEVENEEIAYIKVENLNSAMFKLMRFTVALNSVKFIKVSSLMLKILKNIKFNKNINLATYVVEKLFINVINAKNGEIFFSDDEELIKKITLNFETIHLNFEDESKNNGSIFFSKFEYKDQIYNLNLPQIFIPEILTVLDFMDKENIEIKFRDLRNLGHFEPIFVDKFYNIKGFGESYRAFIVENDEELFIREAKFLNNKFKNGIITMSPKNSNLKTDIKFDSLEEIKVVYDFHYALVLGDKSEILNILTQTKKEISLFE